MAEQSTCATEYAELVERLREWSEGPHTQRLCNEAADALEGAQHLREHATNCFNIAVEWQDMYHRELARAERLEAALRGAADEVFSGIPLYGPDDDGFWLCRRADVASVLLKATESATKP